MPSETRDIVEELNAYIDGDGDNRLVTIPPAVLRRWRAEIARLRAPEGWVPPQSMLDFDSFLNEPPPYEDKCRVREYRHEAYGKWQRFVTDLRAMLSASPATPAPEAWQPMETAPKNRDIIVGYGHGVVAGAFWHEPRQAWFEVGMDPQVAEPCEPHGWIPMPDDATLIIKLWEHVSAATPAQEGL